MVDCHTFPSGELESSIVAPLVRGMAASSVAGAMLACSCAYTGVVCQLKI